MCEKSLAGILMWFFYTKQAKVELVKFKIIYTLAVPFPTMFSHAEQSLFDTFIFAFNK